MTVASDRSKLFYVIL